jgi:hypothetical protein
MATGSPDVVRSQPIQPIAAGGISHPQFQGNAIRSFRRTARIIGHGREIGGGPALRRIRRE